MFYAASALLASKRISRSKHSGVISAFGEQFVKTGLIEIEYVKMLGRAFEARNDSDYDISFTSNRQLAERLSGEAKRFVARAERYLQEARSS